MGTQNTAVTTQQKSPLSTVSGLLTKYKEQIAMALPKHLTPERMIRVALTAISRNPKLLECDPNTICGAVVQASILGLEPDSILGEAYLVPFYNKKANRGKGGMECQLVTGYQGKLKLVRNTDQLVTIAHDVVRAKDEFEYENGIEPFLRHKKAPGSKKERGEITHFWAGVLLKGGGKQIAVMTLGEMEEHRDDYAMAKNRDGKIFGPWVDNFEEMGLKTVIHQVTKLCPRSARAQMAWRLDEQHEAGIPQQFSVDVPLELQPTPESGAEEPEGDDMPQRKSDQAKKELDAAAVESQKPAGHGMTRAGDMLPGIDKDA